MAAARHWEQDKEATVYIGNLDERTTDSLIWELFIQVGRVVNVHLPKDRVTQTHQGYGFIEFVSEQDADYVAKVMNQVRLFGKPIRVNKASADKQKTIEVGAELFIGNLDRMVDEKTLYDTFGRFGTLVAPPKLARDDANLSKGYGFVSFADFESSDEAVANMNGQYLMNKEISVQYAYKKDGRSERHGDEAERMLAAQARKHNVQLPVQPLPPQLFAQPAAASAPVRMPVNMADARGMSGPPPGFAPPLGFAAAAPPQHMPARPGPPTTAQAASQVSPQVSFQAALQAAPLPSPPSGLPARPPPSVAGYGGPSGFAPGFASPGAYPPGVPTAMNQIPPPNIFPPGFAASNPPSLPPGFQAFGQR